MHGYPPTIDATDVVPLVLRSWDNSFQSIPSNRIALAERGWGLLTYSLLDSEHVPDICVSHNSRLLKTEKHMLMCGINPMTPLQVHTSTPTSATILDNIINQRKRQLELNDSDCLKKPKKTVEDNWENAKKISAGVVFFNRPGLSRP